MSRVHYTCHHGYCVHCFIQCQWESEHVSIYKRGHYYGSLDNEKYTSVEHCVADLSRTGFRFMKENISYTDQSTIS